MADGDVTQGGSQGGGITAGGGSGMQADAGGDVRQMTVGDLLDLAVQQNVDVSPVTDLLNDLNLNVSPDVNIAGRGSDTPPSSVA